MAPFNSWLDLPLAQLNLFQTCHNCTDKPLLNVVSGMLPYNTTYIPISCHVVVRNMAYLSYIIMASLMSVSKLGI